MNNKKQLLLIATLATITLPYAYSSNATITHTMPAHSQENTLRSLSAGTGGLAALIAAYLFITKQEVRDTIRKRFGKNRSAVPFSKNELAFYAAMLTSALSAIAFFMPTHKNTPPTHDNKKPSDNRATSLPSSQPKEEPKHQLSPPPTIQTSSTINTNRSNANHSNNQTTKPLPPAEPKEEPKHQLSPPLSTQTTKELQEKIKKAKAKYSMAENNLERAQETLARISNDESAGIPERIEAELDLIEESRKANIRAAKLYAAQKQIAENARQQEAHTKKLNRPKPAQNLLADALAEVIEASQNHDKKIIITREQ